MTPAQRQARRRARQRSDCPLPPAPQRRPLPRPHRWAAAAETLIALQEEYRAWLDNLPASLEGSRLADKLQTIAELDLEELRSTARLRPRLIQQVPHSIAPSTMVKID